MDYPTFGDYLSGFGEGISALPGAPAEALGGVMGYLGETAGALQSAAGGSGNGQFSSAFDLAGSILAGMAGSATATMAMQAAIVSSPALTAAIAGAMVASPALGVLALGAAAVIVGGLGAAAGQALYDAIGDGIDYLRDEGWFEPGGPFGPPGIGWPDWLDPNGPFFFPPISPLVLDLNGNGLDIVQLEDSNAFFDLDINGLAEHTAWIAPEDGFLALDWNENGIIDNMGELFGGTDVDGFTVLSELDSNQDGIIDFRDADFDRLVVWRDTNSDGASATGELASLADSGIYSVNLEAEFVDQWDGGNWISHIGNFQYDDESFGQIYDIWFENNQVVHIDRNVDVSTIPDAIKLLPNLAGYGDVRDLWVELADDPSLLDDAEEIVSNFGSGSTGNLLADIEALLLKWAGVDGVPAGSRGGAVDARHLAFLEAVHGQDFIAFNNASNPGPNAGRALESYFDKVIASFAVKFMTQLPLAHYMLTGDFEASFSNVFATVLSSVRYDATSDILSAQPNDIALSLLRVSNDGSSRDLTTSEVSAFVEGLKAITSIAPALSANSSPFMDRLYIALSLNGADDLLLTLVGQDAPGTPVIGTDENDLISLGANPNAGAVYAGRGDDSISGNRANNVYIYARGDGADTITETINNGTDKLVLEGIDPAEVTLARNGNDVTLVIAESAPGAGDGGSVLIKAGLNDYPEGKRAPQAFFSTDIALDPTDIMGLFVRRWQVEVTFAETRAHLGVETQRQWSDKAIERTTPALLGLYSLVSLWACDRLSTASTPHAAAWYRKTNLTFTDAIGAVRLALWVGDIYRHSPPNREQHKIPPDRLVRMAEALCFAA